MLDAAIRTAASLTRGMPGVESETRSVTSLIGSSPGARRHIANFDLARRSKLRNVAARETTSLTRGEPGAKGRVTSLSGDASERQSPTSPVSPGKSLRGRSSYVDMTRRHTSTSTAHGGATSLNRGSPYAKMAQRHATLMTGGSFGSAIDLRRSESPDVTITHTSLLTRGHADASTRQTQGETHLGAHDPFMGKVAKLPSGNATGDAERITQRSTGLPRDHTPPPGAAIGQATSVTRGGRDTNTRVSTLDLARRDRSSTLMSLRVGEDLAERANHPLPTLPNRKTAGEPKQITWRSTVLPDDHKPSCKAAYASGELNRFLACVECGVTQMRETSLLFFDKLKAMSNQLQASSHEAKELQRNEVRAMAPSLNAVNASSLELFKSYQLLRSEARHVDTQVASSLMDLGNQITHDMTRVFETSVERANAMNGASFQAIVDLLQNQRNIVVDPDSGT